MKNYVTCSQCNKIEQDKFACSLDGKSWCSSCWDDRLYGAERALCAQRGYHETARSTGESPRSKYEYDQLEKGLFRVVVYCACGQRAEFYDIPGILSEDGTGYYWPLAEPKRWFLLEGEPMILADAQSAQAAG